MYAVPWGCSVPWGVFSTVEGYHEYRGGCSVPWGDILNTVGVFNTVRGYHEYHGGLSWVLWGCSVPWGMFSTVGGYHDARGGISWVPWRVFSTVAEKIFCYLRTPWYWTPPMVLSTPTVLHTHYTGWLSADNVGFSQIKWVFFLKNSHHLIR